MGLGGKKKKFDSGGLKNGKCDPGESDQKSVINCNDNTTAHEEDTTHSRNDEKGIVSPVSSASNESSRLEEKPDLVDSKVAESASLNDVQNNSAKQSDDDECEHKPIQGEILVSRISKDLSKVNDDNEKHMMNIDNENHHDENIVADKNHEKQGVECEKKTEEDNSTGKREPGGDLNANEICNSSEGKGNIDEGSVRKVTEEEYVFLENRSSESSSSTSPSAASSSSESSSASSSSASSSSASSSSASSSSTASSSASSSSTSSPSSSDSKGAFSSPSKLLSSLSSYTKTYSSSLSSSFSNFMQQPASGGAPLPPPGSAETVDTSSSSPSSSPSSSSSSPSSPMSSPSCKPYSVISAMEKKQHLLDSVSDFYKHDRVTTVEFIRTPQGLFLGVYKWKVTNPKGKIVLIHGYSSHTRFEWLHHPAHGEKHKSEKTDKNEDDTTKSKDYEQKDDAHLVNEDNENANADASDKKNNTTTSKSKKYQDENADTEKNETNSLENTDNDDDDNTENDMDKKKKKNQYLSENLPTYDNSWIQMLNDHGYDVYALDLQSFGLSDSLNNKMAQINDFDDFARDVIFFLHHYVYTPKSDVIFSVNDYMHYCCENHDNDNYTPIDNNNTKESKNEIRNKEGENEGDNKKGNTSKETCNQNHNTTSEHKNETDCKKNNKNDSSSDGNKNNNDDNLPLLIIGISMGACVVLRAVEMISKYKNIPADLYQLDIGRETSGKEDSTEKNEKRKENNNVNGGLGNINDENVNDNDIGSSKDENDDQRRVNIDLRGAILLCPMIDLETLKKKHRVKYILGNFLAKVAPNFGVAERTKNTLYPECEKFVLEDPLTYKNKARAHLSMEMIRVSDAVHRDAHLLFFENIPFDVNSPYISTTDNQHINHSPNLQCHQQCKKENNNHNHDENIHDHNTSASDSQHRPKLPFMQKVRQKTNRQDNHNTNKESENDDENKANNNNNTNSKNNANSNNNNRSDNKNINNNNTNTNNGDNNKTQTQRNIYTYEKVPSLLLVHSYRDDLCDPEGSIRMISYLQGKIMMENEVQEKMQKAIDFCSANYKCVKDIDKEENRDVENAIYKKHQDAELWLEKDYWHFLTIEDMDKSLITRLCSWIDARM